MSTAGALILEGSEFLCRKILWTSSRRGDLIIEKGGAGARICAAAPFGPPNFKGRCLSLNLDCIKYGAITMGDLSIFDAVSHLIIIECTAAENFALPKQLQCVYVTDVSPESLVRILEAAVVSGAREVVLYPPSSGRPLDLDSARARAAIASLGARVRHNRRH